MDDTIDREKQVGITQHDPAPPSTPSTLKDNTVKDRSHSKPAEPVPFNYLQGWRLHIATIALFLSLFLANFEVSIVSTSLIAITDSVQGFSNSNWIVAAYLLGYTGFMIIWAKTSDIFGRRLMQILALFIFTLFSGICGAAQDITQIIIFRAFQGVGGSGTYAVATVVCFELVPPTKFPKYMGMLSIVFALSYTLGPLVGGAIDSGTTWRWIFLLNVPAGIVAMALVLIAMPTDYPYQGNHPRNPWKGKKLLSHGTLQRIDIPGVVLLLAASVLLVFALEEAGIQYKWSSPLVITFCVVAGLLWIAFFAWERYVTSDERAQEPVFPWRFITSRTFVGMLLNTFLVGAPYTIAIVQIPQRLQATNVVSPLSAGIRLLPLTFSSPCGSFLASFLASKPSVPSSFLLLIAAVLQVAGSASLSTLPISTSISKSQYGFQVLLGLGLGMSITTLLLLVPKNCERRDQGSYSACSNLPKLTIAATAMGAITQFRTLGGVTGLSIVTSVMKSSISSHLAELLTPDQVSQVLKSAVAIDTLPQPLQNQTRSLLAKQYNVEMRIVVGFAVAQCLLTPLIWKRKPPQG